MAAKPVERFSKKMDMRKLNRSVDWRLSAANRRAEDARKFSQDTERVACPICGSSRSAPLAEIYGFPYVRCLECTHVYVRDIPGRESLKKFYENKLQGVAMRPSEDLVRKDLYLTRVTDISLPKVRHETKCLGSKGLWVDIGCGSGELLYAARKAGWKTVGYEIDPEEIHIARDVFGLDVREGYLNDQNAGEILKGASVVSFFSVLEHVPFPMDLVALVRKFAPKTAALVLELPHHPSLSALTNMAFPDLVARHMLPPNHLSLFTDESMRWMLEKNGFTPAYVWYYGQDFFELIGTVLAQAKHKEDEVIHQLLDRTGDFQEILDKAKLCDEFIVIAKRKR